MAPTRRALGYGLTANVVILGIVSLLTDVSSEMILPILPFFLVDVLLADALILGLIEGLGEGVVSFLKVLSGRLSDTVGRRKGLVAAGYGVSAAMKAAFPFAPSWPPFLGMRVLERSGKGIRDAPRDALLAESVPAETRGKAFGFHRSMDTTGAIAGPLITLALLASIGGTMIIGDAYRLVMLLAALPALVSFAFVSLVRETPRPPAPRRPLRLSFRGAPPALLSFVAIAGLFSLAEFSYVFLLLRVGGEEGTVAAILLYVFFNVVYAASALPAGSLSDRVGRKPVILSGYACFAAMALLLANAPALPSVAAFVSAFALYGLSFGMTQGTERALVADLAPSEVKATVLGAYHTVVGMVKIASGIIAGFLWTVLLPEGTATFWFAFAASSVAALALAIWRPPIMSAASAPDVLPHP